MKMLILILVLGLNSAYAESKIKYIDCAVDFKKVQSYDSSGYPYLRYIIIDGFPTLEYVSDTTENSIFIDADSELPVVCDGSVQIQSKSPSDKISGKIELNDSKVCGNTNLKVNEQCGIGNFKVNDLSVEKLNCIVGQ